MRKCLCIPASPLERWLRRLWGGRDLPTGFQRTTALRRAVSCSSVHWSIAIVKRRPPNFNPMVGKVPSDINVGGRVDCRERSLGDKSGRLKFPNTTRQVAYFRKYCGLEGE